MIHARCEVEGRGVPPELDERFEDDRWVHRLMAILAFQPKLVAIEADRVEFAWSTPTGRLRWREIYSASPEELAVVRQIAEWYGKTTLRISKAVFATLFPGSSALLGTENREKDSRWN